MTGFSTFRDASGVGQQVAAASVPVVLASDVPVSIVEAANQEWTLVGAIAVAASTQIKGSGGRVGKLALRLDATAPTATYYVQLFDALSATGVPRVAVKVIHTSGTDDKISIDMGADGVRFATGIAVGLSSTETTYTSAGAYLAVEAATYKA